MTTIRALGLATCIAAASFSGARAAEPIPFNVPPGFAVEKVAGAPLVQHPMFACFDDRGRLFVSDSGGKNLKAEDLLKELPSCIRVLEDTKGNGVFDKSSIFADKMSFPMGCLWHDGAVYVCSPPSLWRLRDTKGTGAADERVELITKFGFSGNAADIHGPWLGPDGRLYWTDGRHGHEIKKPDGTIQTKGKAARIFRSKVDGSEVEVICGGGMDDPVQMAFTEEGEPFAVVDIFESRPARMDALIYCIDGGVFPYYEAVLGEFKRTGPLLPAVSELGWVAPSGLIRYRGTAFGKDYTDNLFSTQFNTHKIVRNVLQRDGASFKSKDEDFITSDNPDFHPTSLVEDADGSLLIIDTGGWFRIGCPTSQVAKPEIKGGIYRVRRRDAPKIDFPWPMRFTSPNMPRLRNVANLLGSPRPHERDQAVAYFAKRADVDYTVNLAQGGGSLVLRTNAIWALSRIGTDYSHEAIKTCLNERDSNIRQTAARALGLHRYGAAARELRRCLGDHSESVRREAAIALGRIRDTESVPLLLNALATKNDRFLEHALIFALIEIGERQASAEGLKSTSPAVQKGALIALDQMANGNLTKTEILPFLVATDRALQQAAWQIAIKHSDWLGDVTGLIRKELQAGLSAERREALRELLIAACQSLAVEVFVAETLTDKATSEAGRLLLLEVVAAADGSKPPPSLVAALNLQLQRPEQGIVRQAIRAIQTRGTSDCDDVLQAILASESPAELKLTALAVVAPRLKELSPTLFNLTLSRWADDPRITAQILGTTKLSEDQLIKVAGILPQASALEMPRLLDAFRQSSSEKVGLVVVEQLGRARALASIAAADLRGALANFPANVQTAAAPLFKKLAVDDPALRQKLADLDGVWKTGEVQRGKVVFFGRKALCSACHAAQGQGERIGPDLSKIGPIRTESDLLESIVIPSASIARGFESCTVHTSDGKSTSGLIRRETADALHLITSDRVEVRIPRSRIESLEASRVSVMPQGLEAQMTRQELGDLIAFLKSLK